MSGDHSSLSPADHLLALGVLAFYAGAGRRFVDGNQQLSWFGLWAKTPAPPASVVSQSLWGTWVHNVAGFDPVLWSMQFEILGSSC